MKSQSIIWIVGGSSGIGLELVKILLHNEHKVIVSSRKATTNESLTQLTNKYPNTLKTLDYDIINDDANNIVKDMFGFFGGVDMWFYNAASYEIMPFKKWKSEHFIQMNHTNYLGVTKIICALQANSILPKRWIWNVSLASYFGLPYGGAYSAPKAALTNLAESIYPELKSLGINLQIINHGFVKTRLTSKNNFPMPGVMEPYECASKIYKNLYNLHQFEIRFPFSLMAFLKLLQLLPYKLSLKLTQKMLSNENK